eukprot:2392638-Pleurochrysis_carterae.AAC.1
MRACVAVRARMYIAIRFYIASPSYKRLTGSTCSCEWDSIAIIKCVLVQRSIVKLTKERSGKSGSASYNQMEDGQRQVRKA